LLLGDRLTIANGRWQMTSAGMLIPEGKVIDRSERSGSHVLEISADVDRVRELFKESGVDLPEDCELSKFMDNAAAVASKWQKANDTPMSYVEIFATMHMLRISKAILTLSDHPRRAQYLARLIGEVDFFKRVESKAKDILWELELWETFKPRVKGRLQDPPDIVLEFPEGEIAIACKKTYSEGNFEKTLSGAVAQTRGFDAGVVAINIDQFTAADSVLRAQSEQAMAATLREPCLDFLRRHERFFRKYLSQGRLIAVLASIHVIVDLKEEQTRFNNAHQSVAWAIPGLTGKKAMLLERFKGVLTDPSPRTT
jgi:hypothetical protein